MFFSTKDYKYNVFVVGVIFLNLACRDSRQETLYSNRRILGNQLLNCKIEEYEN